MTNAVNGILLVDKAEGWTSHDVVAKARRALGTRKVGHAGTLDPMATGLLVLGAGPSTRLLTHLVGLDKTYTATIRLGVTTVTDDREGDVLQVASEANVTRVAANPTALAEAVAQLTGAIEQAPSSVSAIKVDGRRAYDRVRAGEDVELKKRPVTIYEFQIGEPRIVRTRLPASTPNGEAAAEAADGVNSDVETVEPSGSSIEVTVIDIEATVRCSTGTYIRALARDLGEALGVGGHLTALRRTEVGPFSVANAVSNERLASGAVLTDELLSPSAAAAQILPVLHLTEPQEIDLGHGKRLEVGEGQVLTSGEDRAALAAAVAPSGRLVGLVEVKNGRTRVVTNFPTVDE